MKVTAIIVALNEAPFIDTVIRAIYPYVQRIFVQTGYDRSWNNQPVEPDGTLQKLLSFPDAEGKLTVLIRRIPDEAIARNSLMRMDGYTLNHAHHNTVGMEDRLAAYCEPSDYFWVIDGDEIYDPSTIGPMLAFLQERRPSLLWVRGLTYFRTWNYVVHPSDEFFQPGFVKPGLLFRENRNLEISPLWRVLFNKYTRPALGPFEHRALARAGLVRLPEEIAVFHHGAYVGDDQRIDKKIRLSVHHSEQMRTWYDEVWRKWTPSMTNIHPLNPGNFPGVRHVPTAELPRIIAEAAWPDGYIEH